MYTDADIADEATLMEHQLLLMDQLNRAMRRSIALEDDDEELREEGRVLRAALTDVLIEIHQNELFLARNLQNARQQDENLYRHENNMQVAVDIRELTPGVAIATFNGLAPFQIGSDGNHHATIRINQGSTGQGQAPTDRGVVTIRIGGPPTEQDPAPTNDEKDGEENENGA